MSETTVRPTASAEELAAYAVPEISARLSASLADGTRRVHLSVTGMRCASCAWLAKSALESRSGVVSAQVDVALQRAEVVYIPELIKLDALVEALTDAGFGARVYQRQNDEAALEEERRDRLRDLGLSVLFGMQVMLASLALYIGEEFGMADNFREVFRHFAMLMAGLVIAMPARRFYAGAYAALRHQSLTMDVPVAAALTLAYVGSVHATITGSGEVFYDSVAMFTVLLSGVRYIEFTARQRALANVRTLSQRAPASALLLAEEGPRWVAAASLVVGDNIMVRTGHTVPADGTVIAGAGAVDESLLTGEPTAIRKSVGDSVLGGSINQSGAFEVRVSAAGANTMLAQMTDLAGRAAGTRPEIQMAADRLAGWFLAVVGVVAAGVAAYWLSVEDARWLANTISVLIVTCPCALSLATPATLTRAINAMLQRGLVVVGGDAVLGLARTTHLVADKTGTVTVGEMELTGISCVDESAGQQAYIRVAAALEQGAAHPIAASLRNANEDNALESVQDRRTHRRGVIGTVSGTRYALGAPAWVASLGTVTNHRFGCTDDPARHVVQLARFEDEHCDVTFRGDLQVLAAFSFADRLRPDAAAFVAGLRERGITFSMASGDRPDAVEHVARELGADTAAAVQTPADKLRKARALQARGEHVAMLGDGANDVPALAGAGVSIAMGNGAAAACAHADAILLRPSLSVVLEAFGLAAKARQIVHQNLMWAIGYNLTAIPLAATGMVPPWVAAIGMSLSSLLVLTNALRVR